MREKHEVAIQQCERYAEKLDEEPVQTEGNSTLSHSF